MGLHPSSLHFLPSPLLVLLSLRLLLPAGDAKSAMGKFNLVKPGPLCNHHFPDVHSPHPTTHSHNSLGHLDESHSLEAVQEDDFSSRMEQRYSCI